MAAASWAVANRLKPGTASSRTTNAEPRTTNVERRTSVSLSLFLPRERALAEPFDDEFALHGVLVDRAGVGLLQRVALSVDRKRKRDAGPFHRAGEVCLA